MIINEDNIRTMDYNTIIDTVDLNELTEFIISLPNKEWVPTHYWGSDVNYGYYKPDVTNEPVGTGQLIWSIYSFLTIKEYIKVENPYWVGRDGNHSLYPDENEYYKHYSYYNSLELPLYEPILRRLLIEGNFILLEDGQCKINNIKPIRQVPLHKLSLYL